MFDSIVNANDFLSDHWLAEVFPARLKTLTKQWRERAELGKHAPVKGLASMSAEYLRGLGELPEPSAPEFGERAAALHRRLLAAAGLDGDGAGTPETPGTTETPDIAATGAGTLLHTAQGETPITVPLLARFPSPTDTDSLHVLQAVPAADPDSLLAADAELVDPITLAVTGTKTEHITAVSKAITQLFVSEDAPRYLLVIAGGTLLLTDAARWAEWRYLAFDAATALDRRDEKAAGELAHHAGLWSADVLLPGDDGSAELDAFTADSEKHAVGVSEDLREGLRRSIELIANEILDKRRAEGLPVEGVEDLPRDLTMQSLRFLYRILFLLFAEARPELGILPVGAPEYTSGYGLDRLRGIVQTPLTGRSAEGHHLHDSLSLLFRLVNEGHNQGVADGDGLVFEALRSDLFDPRLTRLVDDERLSNRVLQQVLQLLLLSKPSKRKGSRRGYVSYAQLGINQLGAVYEGLMSYTGLIAEQDMVEVAKGGNADKGSWLVPSVDSGDYDEDDIVWREDRLTGRKDIVRHPKGSFVFRLSGRDRQRSASYYTPEVLTKTVVQHALAELLTDDTPAAAILDYRICEPALGSGAFLNEAINQLAAEYLARRQAELGERIEPEDYPRELQKVKAYLALHRAYGVDLNATAVELAEVSLWLNVMHRGLKAPWFGLHLRRGNSLIGARRATYDLTALARAKKNWLKTPPTDRPLSESPPGGGALPAGEIHHFLLPASGWGAVGAAKLAKELEPAAAKALRDWRKAVSKKPDKKQAERLRGLARRVERLWELSLRRLQISEREISRQVDVWGADIPAVAGAVPREQVESALLDPEGPYMRLRAAMDAWCALWYWPLNLPGDGAVAGSGAEPPSLDEWIAGLEDLLGIEGAKKTDTAQGMFHETIENFGELAEMDELERTFYGMRPVFELVTRHRWLGTARAIAEEQGFFHWELDFAQIFARGGFDLQVGNPPWVRPTWKDDVTLAEFDPYFILQGKIPQKTFNARRAGLLEYVRNQRRYLDDLTDWAGTAEHLGSPVEHPVLRGVQTNLYTNFMEKVWRNASDDGVSGLIHPESHFTDPKGGALRAETYVRLRRHWQYVNELMLFEDIGHPVTYGMHIYGSGAESVDFMQIASVLTPETVNDSLVHSGEGAVPGLQHPWGGWDLRAHRSRITRIDDEILAAWVRLFDPVGTPAGQARLLRPLTREHVEILAVLAGQPQRLADVGYEWTSCWHEKGAKADGYIVWRTEHTGSWDEVVYQGPHFTVATPFAKEPNEFCQSKGDYTAWDLTELPESVIPRTNYQRACGRDEYDAGTPQWGGRPATDYWRMAWRKMTQPGLERSLHAAMIPPGVTHVHSEKNYSRESGDARNTVLLAGLWSALPYDYLIKVSGIPNIHAELVDRFPAPLDHPAWPYLLQRTLRLNCLTRDYAPLWEGLYRDSFADDSWTPAFAPYLTGGDALGVAERDWSMRTPFRTGFARRAALVEIDALAALMLGLTADHLALMFRAQFPVLRKYEYTMYFDANGRQIAKDHHAHGVKQDKRDYKLLLAYLDGEDSEDLLDRYTPFPPDAEHDRPWFYHPDREAEMRAAYAEFERRLAENPAGPEGGAQ